MSQTQTKKISILKWILIFLGIALLAYAFFFVRQVLQFRTQILSGEFAPLNSISGDVSGSGGNNIGSGEYDVETADDPSIGSDNPKVVIVEFGDFECPYCKAAFPIIRKLASEYKEYVRFEFRDFPLTDIHPYANMAAIAGFCAHEQGKFWLLHDLLYTNQASISETTITSMAQSLGLNMQLFASCQKSQRAQADIAGDVADAVAAGVQGTPTWFINGYRVAGVIQEDVLRSVIEDLINAQ